MRPRKPRSSMDLIIAHIVAWMLGFKECGYCGAWVPDDEHAEAMLRMHLAHWCRQAPSGIVAGARNDIPHKASPEGRFIANYRVSEVDPAHRAGR